MKRKLVVAVDFDGTIVRDAYPDIGPLLPAAKNSINSLYTEHNCEIIIWTCREGQDLINCKNFLIKNNINFTTINQNTPSVLHRWNNGDCRKIYADIYIDDRMPFTFKQINWLDLYNYVLEYKYKFDYKFI